MEDYIEHLVAVKGDRIEDYSILYPYVILFYYGRRMLIKKGT